MPPSYLLQYLCEDAAKPRTRNWLSEKEHFAFAWNIDEIFLIRSISN